MGCCERERDCCDLRDELAEVREIAEKRRVQRDYLKDQVEELHGRIHDLECDNLGLSEALAECRHHHGHRHRSGSCGNGRFSEGCCN